MNNTMKKLRQTGRTTRMLESAIALSRMGKVVYVLCADCQQIRHLKGMIGNDNNIRFDVFDLTNVDMRTMKMRGSYPCDIGRRRAIHDDHIVLIDHYALEKFYGLILDTLHAFDQVDTGSNGLIDHNTKKSIFGGIDLGDLNDLLN